MLRHEYILIHNCEALQLFLINKLIGSLLLINFFNSLKLHNRVYNAAMNILEIAIKAAGGTGRIIRIQHPRPAPVPRQTQRPTHRHL